MFDFKFWINIFWSYILKKCIKYLIKIKNVKIISKHIIYVYLLFLVNIMYYYNTYYVLGQHNKQGWARYCKKISRYMIRDILISMYLRTLK